MGQPTSSSPSAMPAEGRGLLSREVIEELSEPFACFRTDGRVLLVNAAWCRVFGGSPGDVVGENFFAIVPQEQLASIRDCVAALLPGNHPISFESPARAADGEKRWLRWILTPLVDQAGELACQAVGFDVTEQRRREDDLKRRCTELERRLEGETTERRRVGQALGASDDRASRAEARLRQAIESVSDGFALWNADERLVMCNQRYRELYAAIDDYIRPGITFAELALRLAESGCLPEAVGREQAWAEERLQQWRQPQIPTVERRLADGRWLLVSGRRTPDGDVVTVHSDITELKRQAEELRAREIQLRAIVDNIPGVVYRRVRHPDGRISYPYHSPQLEHRHGFGPDAVARDPSLLQAAVHPDDRAVWLAAVEESAKHLTPFGVDYRIAMRDGSFHWFRTLASATREADGTVVWDGVSIDITELKATEQALRESEERYRRLIESAPIALLAHRGGRVSFANTKALELLGAKSFADLNGRGVLELIHPDHHPSVPTRPGVGITTAAAPQEIRIRRLDGRTVDVEVVSVPITEQGEPAFQMVLLDITERKRADERVRHLAHHDALTGLPNRVLLLDRLQQALVKARRDQERIAVVMLDLDHFKDINDSLGHPLGDRLLCAVAERLRGTIRESDTLARFGGDEFTLIQTGLQATRGAAVLAEKIVEAVAAPFMIDGREVHTTTSVGVAICPEDGVEPGPLIEHADIALYQAKARGRNRVEFYVDNMSADRRAWTAGSPTAKGA